MNCCFKFLNPFLTIVKLFINGHFGSLFFTNRKTQCIDEGIIMIDKF